MSDENALVLIGPMGAGKTSVGRRVAKALGVGFTDSDSVVVREHGPIEDIFRAQGEAEFRRIEREAVQRALASGGVVSLGGGAVLDPDTRSDLSRHRVVLLTIQPRIVASRVRGSARPLLADGEDPMERWNQIYAQRRPIYEELADVVFDTSSGPLQHVVEDIVAWARRTEEAG
ncbi:shikimate kinase [Microbacterium thalassium]|uniref:Shikimate kinase n=1 Tax=Microbacterium thalassium TaxID=362649 RepID=A0A7X0FRK1_9MICO|nr:shikimate kinase [Microbacterium thalassium]MBB6391885.1 shikimate kinase [Microbacterium thalassium]GLK23905.1 shikimate kinase [Microbacterium thalassium]